jgi:hypothetical protein
MQHEHHIASDETQPRPHQVRLPGFITDEAIGLGDVVQRAAYAMGSSPAAGVSGAPLR